VHMRIYYSKHLLHKYHTGPTAVEIMECIQMIETVKNMEESSTTATMVDDIVVNGRREDEYR
jgi:hypothetical protein